MVDRISKLLVHPAVQLIFWLQFAAALSIFAYFTTTPQIIMGDNTDVVLHFTGNFLLFLSARLAFLQIKRNWFVVVFALIYGTAMEIAQYFLPTRYFDPQDLMANWVGVFAGLALALLIELICKKLAKNQAK